MASEASAMRKRRKRVSRSLKTFCTTVCLCERDVGVNSKQKDGEGHMRDVKKKIRIRRGGVDGVLPSREQMEELLGSVCLAKNCLSPPSSKCSISCAKRNQRTTNTHRHHVPNTQLFRWSVKNTHIYLHYTPTL